MHQVKLFVGIEQELATVEAQVNDWIRESNAKVINIIANVAPQTPNPAAESRGALSEGGSRRFSPSDIFLCVVYEAD